SASDNRSVSGVAALPDLMTQEDHGGSAGAIVFVREVSADRGLCPNERKAVPGNVHALISVWHAIVGAETDRAHLHQRNPRKRAGRAVPILKIGLRDAKTATLGIARADHHDAIGLVERQSSQEHGGDER